MSDEHRFHRTREGRDGHPSRDPCWERMRTSCTCFSQLRCTDTLFIRVQRQQQRQLGCSHCSYYRWHMKLKTYPSVCLCACRSAMKPQSTRPAGSPPTGARCLNAKLDVTTRTTSVASPYRRCCVQSPCRRPAVMHNIVVPDNPSRRGAGGATGSVTQCQQWKREECDSRQCTTTAADGCDLCKDPSMLSLCLLEEKLQAVNTVPQRVRATDAQHVTSRPPNADSVRAVMLLIDGETSQNTKPDNPSAQFHFTHSHRVQQHKRGSGTACYYSCIKRISKLTELANAAQGKAACSHCWQQTKPATT